MIFFFGGGVEARLRLIFLSLHGGTRLDGGSLLGCLSLLFSSELALPGDLALLILLSHLHYRDRILFR